MGHNIPCVKIVKLENVVYHFLLNILDNALLAADINHHSDLLLGEDLLIGMGVISQKLYDGIGRNGQHLNKRGKNLGEEKQNSDNSERDFFRSLHGYLLRRKLTENKREIRHNDRDDNDRKSAYYACAESVVKRRALKSLDYHIGKGLRRTGRGKEAGKSNSDLYRREELA